MNKCCRISESCVLPITEGLIEVDTSKGIVNIILPVIEAHIFTCLKIRKISNDRYYVILVADNCKIDNSELIFFGSQNKFGKVMNVSLVSDGMNWHITEESDGEK